jgi:S1-C subfamily serine protease
VTSGKVKRGLLGVELDAKFDGDAALAMGLPGAAGSRVTRIRPGGAADQSGIQVGDVIWTFNRELIQRDQQLVNLVALAPVDQPIPIVIFRDGKPLRREVTLRAQK